MNIAGPLASLIFAITVLTVFGGLFAYGVYKARERTRKKPAAGKKSLQYFIEYELPVATAGGPVPIAVPRPTEGRPWALYALTVFAVTGMIGAGVYYYRSGRRLVLQGAWQRSGTGASAEFPAPPDRPRITRGALLELKLAARRASLFPKAKYDVNADGQLDAAERATLHAEVPQSIVFTVDDNGQAQGLLWLFETFERSKVLEHTTFFLTGNYAEGRPSYLGGPMTDWWSTLAQHGYVGLHGLTHEQGLDWSRQRWTDEESSTLKDIIANVKAPEGWAWNQYPWGSRAPYLSFSDAYFAALDRLSPVMLYDASLVVHPVAPPGAAAAVLPPRDQSWPFSLNTPMPADVELPFSKTLDSRVQIGSHAIYEMPVYSWAIKSTGGNLVWTPSLDVNIFQAHPCSGDGANTEVVDEFAKNLDAHYRGNRAPFHFGLHAQNYSADRRCERKTVEAILAKVAELTAAGQKLKFDSVPRVLESLASEP